MKKNAVKETALQQSQQSFPQEESYHSIFFFNNPFKEKPVNYNFKIYYGLEPIDVSLSELSELVTEGYSWTPASFRFSRCNDQFVSSSMVVIDIDNKDENKYLSIDDLKKRCKKYKLIPNIIYLTFSSTPERVKYRVVFAFNKVCLDKKFYHDVLDVFHKQLFPEADQQCNFISCTFHGGKELVLFDSELNSFKNNQIKSAFKNRWDSGLRVNDNNNIIKHHFQDHYSSINPLEDTLDANNICDNDYKKIEPSGSEERKMRPFKEFKIFNDFLNGKHQPYLILKGIAMNLYWIEGGLKIMIEIINKDDSYNKDDFRLVANIKNQLRHGKKAYKPMSLKNFSPYEEDWKYKNIFDLYHPKGEVIKVYDYYNEPPMTVDDASIELQKAIDRVSLKPKGSITIINCATAQGKTRTLISKQRIIVASPTNELVKELCDESEIEHIRTPYPEDISPELKRQVEILYKNGLHSHVYKLYKKISESYHHPDRNAISCFLHSKINKSDYKNCALYTTHASAILRDFDTKANTIYWDEDPIQYILNTKSIKKSNIIDLFDEEPLCYRDNLKHKILNHISSFHYKPIDIGADDNKIYEVADVKQLHLTTEEILAISEALAKSEKEIPILAMLQTKHILKITDNGKEILHFLNHIPLNPDYNHVILSASPILSLWSMLYPDFEYIDLSNVKYKGTVAQYTPISGSRQSMIKNIELVKEIAKDTFVITYLSHLKYYHDVVPKTNYLGNCRGYNDLIGKDITVCGTYRIPAFTIILYGLEFGINLEGKLLEKRSYVTYKGLNSLQHYFFKNKTLQLIQCEFIESEIIQAIGRSRHLRFDVRINVISSFPILLADNFIYKKKTSTDIDHSLIENDQDVLNQNEERIENDNTEISINENKHLMPRPSILPVVRNHIQSNNQKAL